MSYDNFIMIRTSLLGILGFEWSSRSDGRFNLCDRAIEQTLLLISSGILRHIFFNNRNNSNFWLFFMQPLWLTFINLLMNCCFMNHILLFFLSTTERHKSLIIDLSWFYHNLWFSCEWTLLLALTLFRLRIVLLLRWTWLIKLISHRILLAARNDSLSVLNTNRLRRSIHTDADWLVM